jgi:hypothetical protein
MSATKRFTNATGAPVAENTNIMTAGPRCAGHLAARKDGPFTGQFGTELI